MQRLSRIRPHLPSRAMAVAMLALFLNLTAAGYAATGGTTILGGANTADKTTSLTATPATGVGLAVTNTGGGPAATFKSSGAPIGVGSTARVADLNADLLDTIDSSKLLDQSTFQVIPPVTVTIPPGTHSDTLILATVGHYLVLGGCRRNSIGDNIDLTQVALQNNQAHTTTASMTSGSPDYSLSVALGNSVVSTGTPE